MKTLGVDKFAKYTKVPATHRTPSELRVGRGRQLQIKTF